MKDILKKKGIKIALAVLAAVLVLGLSAVFLGGRSNFLKNIGDIISEPFKKGISAVAGELEHIYGYMYSYDSLAAENEELHRQLASMEAKVREAETLADENARFRALLGFDARHTDFSYESAIITSWTSSNWSSAFTISKGSDDGISLGDSVITSDGNLIGTVTELGTGSATVTTVIDTTFSAGALISSSGVSCVAEGDFSLMSSGQLRLTYLPSGAELSTGEVIETSGIGGIIPRGISIGTVTSVKAEKGSQSLTAVITPLAKFSSLSQIFVVTDYDYSE